MAAHAFGRAWGFEGADAADDRRAREALRDAQCAGGDIRPAAGDAGDGEAVERPAQRPPRQGTARVVPRRRLEGARRLGPAFGIQMHEAVVEVRLAVGGLQTAEISTQCSRRRHESDGLRWILTVPSKLKTTEEEELVTDDLTSECASELVPLQTVLPGSKIVDRICISVAKEFER